MGASFLVIGAYRIAYPGASRTRPVPRRGTRSLRRDGAEEFGAGLGPGHEEGDVAAAEDEPRAHLDVLLHGRVVVDAAHARVLAVLPAGGDDRVVGAHDLEVIVLAGDPHLERQVV